MVRAAVPLPTSRVLCLVTVLLLPSATAEAARRQPIDYVLPTPELLAARAVTAATSSAPVCLGCGIVPVTYVDFRDREHRLLSHPGRHVALLLPEVPTLTAEEIERFLDLLDLAYAAYADLLGAEPAGDGLLPIAFVPNPFGGQAFVSRKGIEIDPGLQGDIRRLLAIEALPQTLIHEMGHNFDFYSPRLQYLPDHFHAWTYWMDLYLPYYLRAGEITAGLPVDPAGFLRPPRSPRELLRLAVRGNWRVFLDDPEADWQRCVRDSGCRWWHNQVWGGFYLNLSALHGPAVTRDALHELTARTRELAFAGPAAERREELWLEPWAHATRSDVSCYAEAVRWHSSDAFRDSLQALYGSRAPLCEDRDGDGVRPIEGDCDDADPAVHPGRHDVANRVDDDCDGHVDEESLDETGAKIQEIPFPAEVEAFGKKRGKKKEFVFEADGEAVAWAEICYRDKAQGWFYFLDGVAEGAAHGTPGDCVYGKVVTPAGEPLRLRHDTHARGGYDLLVAPGDPWPVPWAELAEPAVRGGKLVLRADTDLSWIDETPTRVRFWVSGAGWVAERKFHRRASATWKLPAGMPPGRYGVRAQLLRDGVPVSQASPMRVFEIE